MHLIRTSRIAALWVGCASLVATAQTQSLYDAFRRPTQSEWSAFVMVSLSMPTPVLVDLAREAQKAGVPLVLAGFDRTKDAINSSKMKVQNINFACCEKTGGARWEVDPTRFEKFQVRAVPTFVIYRGETPDDYTKISGGMALADALKIIAQSSKNTGARAAAQTIYNRAFANE